MGNRCSRKRKNTETADEDGPSKRAGSVCGPSVGEVSKPGTPYLILPGTAKMFSLADSCMTSVSSLVSTHTILGSSGSWLVTADEQARMYLVNPVTCEQEDLPDITTMGIQKQGFSYNLDIHSFMTTRFGTMQDNWGPRWEPVRPQSFTLVACQMREFFYRKVVLSGSPHPSKYAAMLILQRGFGAPAFATSENNIWSLASSPDGVEDAIHYDNQFYSITYSGAVQVWKHDTDTGKMTSIMVGPRLLLDDQDNLVEAIPRLTDTYKSCKKYLVMSLEGQLMVVQKYMEEVDLQWKCSFKVHVLSPEVGGELHWEELHDIGDLVLFVGLNNSMCVSSTEHPEFNAGCIYFTDDELEQAPWRTDERNLYLYNRRGFENRCIGVYNLKKGKMGKVMYNLKKCKMGKVMYNLKKCKMGKVQKRFWLPVFSLRWIGVYNKLKKGKMGKVKYNVKKGKMGKVKYSVKKGKMVQQNFWPPAAWFRPFAE